MYNHGSAGEGWTPDDFDLLRQVVASMQLTMKDKPQYAQTKWCASECRRRHPSFARTGYAIAHKLKDAFAAVMGRECEELQSQLNVVNASFNHAQTQVLVEQASKIAALQQLEQEKARVEAVVQKARAAVEEGKSAVRREFMAKIGELQREKTEAQNKADMLREIMQHDMPMIIAVAEHQALQKIGKCMDVITCDETQHDMAQGKFKDLAYRHALVNKMKSILVGGGGQLRLTGSDGSAVPLLQQSSSCICSTSSSSSANSECPDHGTNQYSMKLL